MVPGLRAIAKAMGLPPAPTVRAPALDPTCERLGVRLPGATLPTLEQTMPVLNALCTRRRHAQKSHAARGRIRTRALDPVDAKSLSGKRAQLAHQNQPPDGSRPLMRRYVTRLP